MGQKTNPIGNRLGIIRGWDSNWWGGRDYGDKIAEDDKIRKELYDDYGVTDEVLKNIINGKPKLVINFEVDYDSSSYIVKRYVDACDYQNNLVSELKKLKQSGKIEIISIKKLSYQNHPINRISAIIWKPV